MTGEPIVTIIGNLTDDPELRFTNNGAAVANFTVASTPRSFDKQRNEWVDGEALFMRCSIWRQAAENAAESLTKGMRVIVQGRLAQRSFEDRDGNKRSVIELQADELGASLAFATAKVTRASRGQTGQRQEPARQQSRGGGEPWGSQPAGDPWASPSSAEPPF